MKRIAVSLLVGLCLTNCADRAPAPAPALALQPPAALAGRWEQVAVHTAVRDPHGQLLDDQWEENKPGSVWLELTTAGVVNIIQEGVVLPAGTTYAYQDGHLLFRGLPPDETRYLITEFTDRCLIYHTHHKVGWSSRNGRRAKAGCFSGRIQIGSEVV